MKIYARSLSYDRTKKKKKYGQLDETSIEKYDRKTLIAFFISITDLKKTPSLALSFSRGVIISLSFSMSSIVKKKRKEKN